MGYKEHKLRHPMGYLHTMEPEPKFRVRPQILMVEEERHVPSL